MRTNYQEWTPEEEAVVRELVPEFGYAHVSSILKRPEKSVRMRSHRLGVKLSDSLWKRLRQEQAERQIRNGKSVNPNYFQTWSPEMAYILGYLWADGTVNTRYQGVGMSCVQSDDYLIRWIRDQFQSKHKVGTFYTNKNDLTKPYTYCMVCSSGLARDLRDLHGMECNKSNKDLPWRDIPQEFFGHFLRGNFDGDGCVYQGINTVGRILCSISFLGTKTWIDGMAKQISESLPMPPRASHYSGFGNTWRLSFHGHENAKALYGALYPSVDVPCLTRKRIKFEKLLLDYASQPPDKRFKK